MATSREMTAGPALPLIFNFTMPLLLGNLLQQTYSLVDAAIVGKFLGINALAAVGASSSVIFLILGFCNGCSCGFGIPVAQKFGARDYAALGGCEFAAFVGDVCYDCFDYQYLLCRYLEDYAYTGEYLRGCVCLLAGDFYRSTLYVSVQSSIQHYPCIGR